MSLKKLLSGIGPGPIIAAAFIGPGTVTVCTLAGYNFGFSLIWAMGLSVLATVILQEMSGRIGLVSGKDLSQIIRSQKGSALFKIVQMLVKGDTSFMILKHMKSSKNGILVFTRQSNFMVQI